jgi:hypothetical protein
VLTKRPSCPAMRFAPLRCCQVTQSPLQRRTAPTPHVVATPVCCQVTQSGAALCRRAVLRTPALLLLAPALARSAEEATSPLGIGQPVRPARPAQAYVKEIARRREETLQSLRGYAAAGQFKELSDSLVLSPFDDLRQACFYLPWAVVPLDEAAGTELEGAWEAVRAGWMNLDTVSLAAARFDGDEPEVTAAIDAFQRALDAYQARIPPSLAAN